MLPKIHQTYGFDTASDEIRTELRKFYPRLNAFPQSKPFSEFKKIQESKKKKSKIKQAYLTQQADLSSIEHLTKIYTKEELKKKIKEDKWIKRKRYIEIKNTKPKHYSGFIPRYEWRQRIITEFASFKVFCCSIRYHYPKEEDWKNVYDTCMHTRKSEFNQLFLSPKFPTTEKKLLKYISTVIDYPRYEEYLDRSTILKKNKIPNSFQTLCLFLKDVQDRRAKLMINNEPLETLIGKLDLGEKRIEINVTSESRVFSWTARKSGYKMTFLVSPCLTQWIVFTAAERFQSKQKYKWRFKYVLSSNEHLNPVIDIGYERILDQSDDEDDHLEGFIDTTSKSRQEN